MRPPTLTAVHSDALATPFAAHARSGSWGHFRSKLDDQGVYGVLSAVGRFFGVLWTWRQHQKLVAVIDQPQTRVLRVAFPRLAYRYTLPYLSTSLAWIERRAALQSHYAFVNEVFDVDFSVRVLNDLLEIWHHEVEGECFSISVQSLCPVTRHREGELTLCFRMARMPIYKLSFSIVALADLPRSALAFKAEGALHALYVGRVQGLTGGMESLRRATVLLGDIAPQDLLMSAMAGLAAALGIEILIGVSDADCVSRDSIARSGSSFCYDQFWARYGSQQLDGGHHLMTLPVVERPIGDIAAKHRRRTQRKRDFKRQVLTSCEQAFRAQMG